MLVLEFTEYRWNSAVPVLAAIRKVVVIVIVSTAGHVPGHLQRPARKRRQGSFPHVVCKRLYAADDVVTKQIYELPPVLGLEEVGEHAGRQLVKRLVGWRKDGERAGA